MTAPATPEMPRRWPGAALALAEVEHPAPSGWTWTDPAPSGIVLTSELVHAAEVLRGDS